MTVRPEDLAAILQKRVSEARARHRDRGERLLGALRAAVCELRSKRKLDAAWLIGSLAWGGFGARSDVDVVVRGADPRHIGELWGQLVEALDASVDLMCLEHLSDGFRQRVLAHGVRLDEP